jgi:hypothetical protein
MALSCYNADWTGWSAPDETTGVPARNQRPLGQGGASFTVEGDMYEKPVLERFGSFRELTRTSSGWIWWTWFLTVENEGRS